MKARVWRRDRESNPARRICNPLHNRFAIAPRRSFWHTATGVRRGRCSSRNEEGKPSFPSCVEPGAGDESRTRDLNLGKVALYQLSYSRVSLAF